MSFYSSLVVSSKLALPSFAVCLHAAASFLSPKALFLRIQQAAELQTSDHFEIQNQKIWSGHCPLARPLT